MSGLIYGVIIILFVVYLLWTWNNTKNFEVTNMRISYIIIGTLAVTLVTYIIFLISKTGIIFQNQAMIGKIRNIILLVFVPVNGFILLPQIASTIGKIKTDNITDEQLKKRLFILIIAIIIIITFEIFYFKNIQNGIIQLINLK